MTRDKANGRCRIAAAPDGERGSTDLETGPGEPDDSKEKRNGHRRKEKEGTFSSYRISGIMNRI